MGIRNYLVEGVSGTGKTSVCDELGRRGYHVIHGDRELAYQGDPQTGEPVPGLSHENHIWDVEAVRAIVGNRRHPMSFFCGGSRNFGRFIDLFDEVFVLQIDKDTLEQRLSTRTSGEWGGQAPERALILRLHTTEEDLPGAAVRIDATAPISRVVDEILLRCLDR
jgi:hypothetical protein